MARAAHLSFTYRSLIVHLSFTYRSPRVAHPAPRTYRSPIVHLSFTYRSPVAHLSSCAFRLSASLSVSFSKQSRQFSKFCAQGKFARFLADAMPSEHTPEWSKIRALKAKIQTGRCTASGGRVGRELTEEELEDCRERLAQLEQKRDQGIHDRRVARETLDNTEQFKEGQRKFAQVNSRLNTVIAPSGSSANLRLQAKEAAKREREEQKQRLLLQQGIVPKEGDFYVGTVLIKADTLDQLEELRDRDLEAEFSLTGLQCRLVQISGLSGIVHLLAPDLAVLKGKRQDLAHYHLKLQAFHKDVFYENLAWKEGSPAHLDGEGKKLPKHASLRLVVPDLVRIALAKLPRSDRRSAERWSLPVARRRRQG